MCLRMRKGGERVGARGCGGQAEVCPSSFTVERGGVCNARTLEWCVKALYVDVHAF